VCVCGEEVEDDDDDNDDDLAVLDDDEDEDDGDDDDVCVYVCEASRSQIKVSLPSDSLTRLIDAGRHTGMS
jgi:hypothetical protein